MALTRRDVQLPPIDCPNERWWSPLALDDNELLIKQLPHSVEAEQAVLGSILFDPQCVPEVID